MKPRHQNSISLAARSSSLLGLCSITFSLLAAGHAMAQTWDGGGTADGLGNYNWADGPNWNPDTAPVGGNSLTFAGATNIATSFNNIAPDTSFAGITFNNTAGAFTLSGNRITLGGNVVNNDADLQTINLNMILSGTRTFDTSSGNIVVGGIISGGANGLTKGGGSTLTLTGANTYTGLTQINGGTLQVSKIADAASGFDSNIGFGTDLRVGTGNISGTLNYTGTGNTTARSVLIGSATGTGTSTINSNGANGGTGLVFSNSTFIANQGSNNTNVSTIVLGGNNTDANQISGIINNSNSGSKPFALTKANEGRWILAGVNTYTGQTVINDGTLEVKTLGNAGVASSLGAGNLNSLIRMGDAGTTGTILYTGSAASATNRQIQIGNGFTSTSTGGATIRSSGAGIVEFTNTAFNLPVNSGNTTTAGSNTRTLTLGGTNTGLNRIAGVIANNTLTETPIVAVTKEDAGQWILEGANTYTGATTVNGGRLTISSTGTVNSSTAVSIGAGEFRYNSSTALSRPVSFSTTGGTVSGTGTITPAVNVTSGNTLAVGDGGIGTMSFGGAVTIGGTYLYELDNTNNLGDLGDVAGNLTLGGILDLVQLGTYAAGDKFTLFAYDGTLSGIFTTIGLANIADDTTFTDGGGIWNLNYNDTTAGLNGGVSASNTYVTITAIPEPGAALLGGLGMLALLRRRRA